MANHPTADLARFCAEIQYEDLSSIVRERVRYLLLDHLAVTIRGSVLPSSLAGYQMLEQMAIGSTKTATIFGRQTVSPGHWDFTWEPGHGANRKIHEQVSFDPVNQLFVDRQEITPR